MDGASPNIAIDSAEPYYERMHYVRFGVEQIIFPLRPDKTPEDLTAPVPYTNPDGSCPFEPGKLGRRE